MGQHHDPDDLDHLDLDGDLGRPVYQGDGLSVRELSAEELQRFLDVHAGQPAQFPGSGWAILNPSGNPEGVPRTPPAGSPARPASSGLGLAGLAVAALMGWRLRFRPSEQTRAWQRGAAGERQTARLLNRLGRDGYQVLHDLAMPDSPANVDHLVVGPSGVVVIDSKRWTGQVHQGSEGLIWHNRNRLDRTLATIRRQALTLDHLLGVPVAPLICVHGAHIQGGSLRAQGVAIVPPALRHHPKNTV